jgi:hypothetical protein
MSPSPPEPIAYPRRRPGGASTPGFWVRHPYLTVSALAHLVLVAALLVWGGQIEWAEQSQRNQALFARTAEHAEAMQLERRSGALEHMQKQLSGRGDAAIDADESSPSPAQPLQRARAAAAAIVAEAQLRRAQELARLTRIPLQQALQQVAAAALALPDSGDIDAQMSALEQVAAQALAEIDHQQTRAAQGSVASSALAQSGAAGAAGSAGRGHGAAGGGGLGDGDGSGRGTGGGRGGHDGEGGGGGSYVDNRAYSQSRTLQIPPARRLGMGRRFGVGGTFADRAYLNTWYVLGPLAAESASSLNQAYLPELGVDLDGAYEGRGGRVLRWQFVQTGSYPMVPQPRAENSVYYALTEIHVDRDQDVVLDIGADDDSKLWLNDTLVWASDDCDKLWYHVPFFKLDGALANYALAEASVRVHLHAGRNRLLFKLYNGVDLMFFSVVLRPA